MADESRPDSLDPDMDESLARFWNALGQGARPDHAAIDPALVDTVRHLHRLDATQPPEPVFVRRLRDELFATDAAASTTTRLNDGFRLNGRDARPAQRSALAARPGLEERRWGLAPFAAAALALLLILGIGYVVFGSGLLDDDRRTTIPAAVEPAATPTPDVLSEGTVVEITIPAAVLPAGVGGSALDHNTILPGTRSTWTVPQNAILRYIVAGTLTVRSDTPVSVLRGGAPAWTDVAPDTEVELGPGDAMLFLNATTAEFANASATPVEMVAWIIASGTSGDGPLPPEWVNNNYALSGTGGVTLTGEPAVLRLERRVLAPGDTIPFPPDGVLQLVIGMPDNGAATPVPAWLPSLISGKAINYVDDPILVYVLTLTFVVPEASPAAGTPPP